MQTRKSFKMLRLVNGGSLVREPNRRNYFSRILFSLVFDSVSETAPAVSPFSFLRSPFDGRSANSKQNGCGLTSSHVLQFLRNIT
jgi:hypothetical protein